MINKIDKIKKYRYSVYGLNVESDILLPELTEADMNNFTHIDCVISYGKMPDEIKQEITEGKQYGFQKEKMWFSIPGNIYFLISNGNSIIIEPQLNSNIQEIKAFLLGSAFGMLFLQRNTVAIHGSTVQTKNCSIILTGNRGMGKSTLTAALISKGYSFMADDISVTSRNHDNVLVVNPAYPQQKLCKDVMEKMGFSIDDFNLIDEEREKYAVSMKHQFIKHAFPIGAIIELCAEDNKGVEIEELTGTEKLKMLMRNIFRIEVTNYCGIKPEYFKKCIEIVKDISFFRLNRLTNRFSLEEEINLLEKNLEYILGWGDGYERKGTN